MSKEKQTLDSSTGLTCITCRLVFGTSDIQRDHYKSEWHRYNVKRQVASLPPISNDDFAAKVKSFDKTTASTSVTDSESLFCKDCRKPFQSKNAYTNHLNSKKHKEALSGTAGEGDEGDEEQTESHVTIGGSPAQVKDPQMFDVASDDDASSSGWRTVHSDDEVEDVDEDDYDESKAINERCCLFCRVESKGIDENIAHMSLKHGFSIPDCEYCTDVVELLKYLGTKIGCGNFCIACSANAKRFRDLESCQKHMRDKNHCSFNLEGENILEYLDFYDYGSLMEEAGEGVVNDDVLTDEGAFLTLPSGAKIGHRALMRYFKQSLKTEKVSSIQSKASKMLLAGGHFKSLGWTGTTGVAAVQKARDIKFMKKVVSQYRLKQGLGANRLFKTRGRKDQQ